MGVCRRRKGRPVKPYEPLPSVAVRVEGWQRSSRRRTGSRQGSRVHPPPLSRVRSWSAPRNARTACYSHRPLVCGQPAVQHPPPWPFAHRHSTRRLARQEGRSDPCAATASQRGEREGRTEHVCRPDARWQRREGQRIRRGSCGARYVECKRQREGASDGRRRRDDRGACGEEGNGRDARARSLDLLVYRPSFVLRIRQLSSRQHRLRHLHPTRALCTGTTWSTRGTKGRLVLAAASAVHCHRGLHILGRSYGGLNRRVGGESRQCAAERWYGQRDDKRLRRRGALPALYGVLFGHWLIDGSLHRQDICQSPTCPPIPHLSRISSSRFFRQPRFRTTRSSSSSSPRTTSTRLVCSTCLIRARERIRASGNGRTSIQLMRASGGVTFGQSWPRSLPYLDLLMLYALQARSTVQEGGAALERGTDALPSALSALPPFPLTPLSPCRVSL